MALNTMADTLFDVDAYLFANPDVRDAVNAGQMTAQQHYNNWGKTEGRSLGTTASTRNYDSLQGDWERQALTTGKDFMTGQQTAFDNAWKAWDAGGRVGQQPIPGDFLDDAKMSTYLQGQGVAAKPTMPTGMSSTNPNAQFQSFLQGRQANAATGWGRFANPAGYTWTPVNQQPNNVYNSAPPAWLQGLMTSINNSKGIQGSSLYGGTNSTSMYPPETQTALNTFMRGLLGDQPGTSMGNGPYSGAPVPEYYTKSTLPADNTPWLETWLKGPSTPREPMSDAEYNAALEAKGYVFEDGMWYKRGWDGKLFAY